MRCSGEPPAAYVGIDRHKKQSQICLLPGSVVANQACKSEVRVDLHSPRLSRILSVWLWKKPLTLTLSRGKRGLAEYEPLA